MGLNDFARRERSLRGDGKVKKYSAYFAILACPFSTYLSHSNCCYEKTPRR